MGFPLCAVGFSGMEARRGHPHCPVLGLGSFRMLRAHTGRLRGRDRRAGWDAWLDGAKMGSQAVGNLLWVLMVGMKIGFVRYFPLWAKRPGLKSASQTGQ